MMNRLIIAVFAVTLGARAYALEVPEGKAAVAEAVIGRVTADSGKGFKKLVLGQALDPGTTVKTGSNGRVALELPDGSKARIAPNTEMTLKDEKVRQGIFTRLLKGTVRFLVAKQGKGHSFETEMPNAVAAVKGTDPEYGTDGKVSTAKVFSSGSPVALLFESKGGEKTEMKAGQKLVFDGEKFQVEELTDEDRKESDKNYNGLPDPGEEGEGEKEKNGGTVIQKKKKDESKKSEGEKSSLEKANDEAMAEATEELYLDGFLERDDRTGDIAAGKIVYDRFGERVQVTHFITREDEKTVEISSFSLRDGGPNKGTSYAIESSTFNAALPENWGPVWERKFDVAANLDGSGYPIYYREKQLFTAGNPFGDTVKVDTIYDVPRWLTPDGVAYIGLVQYSGQDIYVNGQMMLSYRAYPVDYYGPLTQDYYYDGEYGLNGNGTPWINTAAAYENGWRFQFTADDPGNPVGLPAFLTQDIHFLDDAGNLQIHPTFTGIPAIPSDVFKGFDANVELAFSSPLFQGRTIDVMFLRGFFDLYNGVSHPFEDNDGGCIGGC